TVVREEAGWKIEYDIVAAPPNRIVLVGVRLESFPWDEVRELSAERLRRVAVGNYRPILGSLIGQFQRRPSPWFPKHAAKMLRILRERGFGFLLDGQPASTRKPARLAK